MKIFIGADHGGFKLKESLKVWLDKGGHEVVDVGAHTLDSEDDFVDYAFAVADGLSSSLEARGILLCRNGVGVDIAANRFMGIRCALGFDSKQIEKARSDDDVNCLSLPADYLSETEAKEIVEAFLETEFSAKEKYLKRLKKLENGPDFNIDMCCGGGCGHCDHH